MPKLKKAIGCLVVFVLVCVAGYFSVQRANYYSALEATKEWARTAEFPSSAGSIDVEITGGVFSRGFVVTFDAPLADINNWIDKSPGSSNVTPENTNGTRTYSIEAGGGAQFAEIQVDDEKQTVTIRTYWS